MAKKKGKKKAILKRLAKRRGERSRRKRLDTTRSPGISQEARQKAEKAFKDSALLAEREEFKALHFDQDLLALYLKDVEKREIKEPRLFLQEGVQSVVTISFLEEAKERLRSYHEGKKNEDEEGATTAQFILKWLEQELPPSEIPFFLSLFLKDVKNHPLSDRGQVWKLIQPFLPSRIETPQSGILLSERSSPPSKEKEEVEERDERYPHIILPK